MAAEALKKREPEKKKLYNLWIHNPLDGDEVTRDLIINPKTFPGISVGAVIQIYHPTSATDSTPLHPPLLLQVETLEAPQQAALQISIAKPVAELFKLQSRRDVVVEEVQRNNVAVDFLECTFNEQYVSRTDMWRFKMRLVNTAVYSGKIITWLGISAQVRTLMSDQEPRICGVVTESTRFTLRSRSAKFFILVQMSREMWEFADNGDLYYEKVNAFLADLFAHWSQHKATSHVVSIILFSRMMYNDEDVPSEAQGRDSAFRRDQHGRLYEDHYHVVVDCEKRTDWESVLRQLKRHLRDYATLVNDRNSARPDMSRPRGSLTTAAQGNILESVNLCLNVFDQHNIDRDLNRCGQAIVLITAGVGVFEVDETLTQLTKHRMTDNGIGSDIVCLAPPPLHTAPLFIFKDVSVKDKDGKSRGGSNDRGFRVPLWIRVVYYGWDKPKDGSFIPRSRLLSNYVKQQPTFFRLFENNVPSPIFDNQQRSLSAAFANHYDANIFTGRPGTQPPTPNVPHVEPPATISRGRFSTPARRSTMGHVTSPHPTKTVVGSPAVVGRTGTDALGPEHSPSHPAMSVDKSALISPPEHTSPPQGKSARSPSPDGRPTGRTTRESLRSPPLGASTGSTRPRSKRPGTRPMNVASSPPISVSGSSQARGSASRAEDSMADMAASSDSGLGLSPRSVMKGSVRSPGSLARSVSTAMHVLLLKGNNAADFINPFDPTTTNHTLAPEYSRWAHLYPLNDGSNKSSSAGPHAPNWATLSEPACLPLTTDYFPDELDLKTNYQLHSHMLTLDPGHNPYNDSLEKLLRELISQRISQGFQLIVNPALERAAQTMTGVPNTHYYLSIGPNYHKLFYNVGEQNIHVTRYHIKPAEDSVTNMSLDYQYKLFGAGGTSFRRVEVKISHEHLRGYKWGAQDEMICGEFEEDVQQLKWWRVRLVLLPAPGSGHETDAVAVKEERKKRIIGFTRFKEALMKATKLQTMNIAMPSVDDAPSGVPQSSATPAAGDVPAPVAEKQEDTHKQQCFRSHIMRFFHERAQIPVPDEPLSVTTRRNSGGGPKSLPMGSGGTTPTSAPPAARRGSLSVESPSVAPPPSTPLPTPQAGAQAQSTPADEPDMSSSAASAAHALTLFDDWIHGNVTKSPDQERPREKSESHDKEKDKSGDPSKGTLLWRRAQKAISRTTSQNILVDPQADMLFLHFLEFRTVLLTGAGKIPPMPDNAKPQGPDLHTSCMTLGQIMVSTGSELEVKMRGFLFKRKQAFVGKDAVNWLAEHLVLEQREDALAVAQLLLDRGVINAVSSSKKPFEDSANAYYHIAGADDAEKRDKQADESGKPIFARLVSNLVGDRDTPLPSPTTATTPGTLAQAAEETPKTSASDAPREPRKPSLVPSPVNDPTAAFLEAQLDQFVGISEAKEALRTWYRALSSSNRNTLHRTSLVTFQGPTGLNHTHVARVMSEVLERMDLAIPGRLVHVGSPRHLCGWQKGEAVSLVRAMLATAEGGVLVVDDATAALDESTLFGMDMLRALEEALQKALPAPAMIILCGRPEPMMRLLQSFPRLNPDPSDPRACTVDFVSLSLDELCEVFRRLVASTHAMLEPGSLDHVRTLLATVDPEVLAVHNARAMILLHNYAREAPAARASRDDGAAFRRMINDTQVKMVTVADIDDGFAVVKASLLDATDTGEESTPPSATSTASSNIPSAVPSSPALGRLLRPALKSISGEAPMPKISAERGVVIARNTKQLPATDSAHKNKLQSPAPHAEKRNSEPLAPPQRRRAHSFGTSVDRIDHPLVRLRNKDNKKEKPQYRGQSKREARSRYSAAPSRLPVRMEEARVELESKSDRYEWLKVKYETEYNPDEAYHFELHWLVCTATSLSEYVQMCVRRARQVGFVLLQVPVVAVVRTVPWRAPIFVPLQMHGLSVEEEVQMQEAIMRAFEFMRDRSMPAAFTHRGGSAMVRIVPGGFLWIRNTCQSEPAWESLLTTFRDICSSQERVAALLQNPRAVLAHPSDAPGLKSQQSTSKLVHPVAPTTASAAAPTPISPSGGPPPVTGEGAGWARHVLYWELLQARV